jgi:hypothetical protein
MAAAFSLTGFVSFLLTASTPTYAITINGTLLSRNLSASLSNASNGDPCDPVVSIIAD